MKRKKQINPGMKRKLGRPFRDPTKAHLNWINESELKGLKISLDDIFKSLKSLTNILFLKAKSLIK